jgi:hypothetical protein
VADIDIDVHALSMHGIVHSHKIKLIVEVVNLVIVMPCIVCWIKVGLGGLSEPLHRLIEKDLVIERG